MAQKVSREADGYLGWGLQWESHSRSCAHPVQRSSLPQRGGVSLLSVPISIIYPPPPQPLISLPVLSTQWTW